MVFPKWITALGAILASVGAAVEALRQAIDFQAISPWLSVAMIAIGTIAAAGGRALGDDDADGTPNLIDPDWKRGGARVPVLVALVLAGIGAACVTRVAAQPLGTVVVADLRVGAVCGGPATMTGCLVSLYDSTANVSIATGVAVAKGDTLWRSRPCTSNESVVIGGVFVGTRAGASNSAPVGARATGSCTAQAGQPSPLIIVEVVP